MPFRHRRRIRILPGLDLNLSKSGIGCSAGQRGIHIGIDYRKRPYWSVGVPGTGLSWREYGNVRPRPAGVYSGGCVTLALIIIGVVALLAIVLKK